MISVALTTYNGEKYIKKQLDSILNQTVKVDEIIVCDDGSTDSTCNILNQFPIKLYRNSKNLGYRLNFKQALEKSNGDYIFLCDQDDIWNKTKVEEMMHIMKSHNHILSLASSFEYIDSNDTSKPIKLDKKKSNNNLFPKFVKENDLVNVPIDLFFPMNYFQGCSLCITKQLRDLVILNWNTNMEHDYLINTIAASLNGMYFYNKSLFKYRLHENNAIGVSYYTMNSNEHIENASKLQYRLQDAKNALNVLQIIREINPNLYHSREEEFIKFQVFLNNHINFISNNQFIPLLLQNSSSFYPKIKPFKARIMDLLFVLQRKFKGDAS